MAKGLPWAIARAGRCRGLLADEDQMDNEFTAALENHAQTPDVFEAARTRLAYGARLRRSRQRMRSREQLRAAIDQFDLLGAGPWSKMARAELTATGETARQPGPSNARPADPAGAANSLTFGRRPHDPRGCGLPVPQPENGRVPLAQCLQEARYQLTR